MSLPDRTAVKLRLRIENDVEDADIDAMLASALATITETIGRPITATERTWLIEQRGNMWGDMVASCVRIFTPLYPIDPDTVEILDADGDSVTDFRVNGTTGMIVATNGEVFDNFPYEVTADVGLSLMDDFSTRVEPKLSQAFLDLCADWYQRRNPGALAEGAGGGVITQWQTLGVPERICKQLDAYRLSKAY